MAARSYPATHVSPCGFPLTGSRWRHKSGVVYVVLFIANEEESRQEEFPTEVVYQSGRTGKRYTATVDEVPGRKWWFNGSYEPIE